MRSKIVILKKLFRANPYRFLKFKRLDLSQKMNRANYLLREIQSF